MNKHYLGRYFCVLDSQDQFDSLEAAAIKAGFGASKHHRIYPKLTNVGFRLDIPKNDYMVWYGTKLASTAERISPLQMLVLLEKRIEEPYGREATLQV